MQWIKDRLTERSTWAGIITLLTGLGVKVAPELAESVATVGVALVSALWILIGDKKPPAPPAPEA